MGVQLNTLKKRIIDIELGQKGDYCVVYFGNSIPTYDFLLIQEGSYYSRW